MSRPWLRQAGGLWVLEISRACLFRSTTFVLVNWAYARGRVVSWEVRSGCGGHSQQAALGSEERLAACWPAPPSSHGVGALGLKVAVVLTGR